jgi:hypothetical protein
MSYFVVVVFAYAKPVDKPVVPCARLLAPRFGPGNGNGKSGMFLFAVHITKLLFCWLCKSK